MSSVYFLSAGSGIPVVFLHGFCESGRIWSEFARPFESDFKIYLPDLPGFGKSPLPDFISIDNVADEIAFWLIENKIQNSIIVGHSLGGYVALSLADRHPKLADKIVLFHSTCFDDTEEKRKNRNKTIEFVETHGVPPYVETFVPGLFLDKHHQAIPFVRSVALETKKETLVAYTAAMRDRAERAQVLRKSDISKLIITGVADTLIPVASSREMAKIGVNSQYYELEKVAHMGLFEAPERCRDIIRNFSLNIT